ncbi:MAG: CpsD/CapB family tyrosine-protein kinase [Candidatus Omnitrophica bacterium]|nr:CpsD/CapB family tyrosine-protein kinase [Candidatus Omnitrophota bacterium]
MVGLLLGLFTAFLKEDLRLSLLTIEETEACMKLPVLGSIPHLAIAGERKGPLIIHQSNQSTAAESYRSLRTAMFQVSPESQQAKTWLVTSSGPKEGKSLTCANLAISIAWTGRRVLLVDSDLRRPSLDKLFSLERKPGLTDYLSGVATHEQIMRRGPAELANLSLVTSGRLMSNPAEMLNGDRLSSWLNQLRLDFDLILFDAPPVLTVTDASILGSKVEATILIYQTGRTSRAALRRVKNQLQLAGAKIKGIVLNNVSS